MGKCLAVEDTIALSVFIETIFTEVLFYERPARATAEQTMRREHSQTAGVDT